jgi:hypothetical protein
VKQIALCVVLITFAGESTLSQTHSEKSIEVTLSQSSRISDPPEEAKTTLKQSTVIDSSTHRQLLENAIDRSRMPFIVFVDPSISSTSATTKETKYVDAGQVESTDESFHWSAAIKQSLIFLGVQHGYALTQPKTRRDLKGSFFRDYGRSVKSLHGWADGGRFFTNYMAHPMQGSFLGFIQVQNDPKGMKLRFNESSAYWRSRLKALAWSAVWSTQFEIGPVSQASVGNVGLHGKQTYVDIVMTPTAGFGLLVLEDFLDENLIKVIERKSKNFYVRMAGRTLLNPTRSVANLLRFKTPWYRDEGLR